MPAWTGKTKGKVLGFQIFILFIKIFRIEGAYFLLHFVSLFYLVVSPKKNLYYYFSKRLKEKNWLLLKVYKNYLALGKVIIDRFAILSGIDTKFSFDFIGEEYLHQIADEKKGGILVGAHLGNWEVAGQLLERLRTKVNIVMYDGEREEIKEFMNKVMKNRTMNFIFIKENSFNHLKEIDAALKRGELIAMHGDRSTSENAVIEETFLNQSALFPTGPFYLANKYKVPVSFVFTLKESRRHYTFYASEPKKYNYSGNPSKAKVVVRSILNDYICDLEKYVHKYPYQWFNYHEFWKDKY